jgi:hypothetical protein
MVLEAMHRRGLGATCPSETYLILRQVKMGAAGPWERWGS